MTDEVLIGNQMGANANASLFPLFSKSSKDAGPRKKSDKCGKTDGSKRQGSKKDKKANGKGNEPSDQLESIQQLIEKSEENLETVDVRAVVKLFEKVKICVKDLKEHQAQELEKPKVN